MTKLEKAMRRYIKDRYKAKYPSWYMITAPDNFEHDVAAAMEVATIAIALHEGTGLDSLDYSSTLDDPYDYDIQEDKNER